MTAIIQRREGEGRKRERERFLASERACFLCLSLPFPSLWPPTTSGPYGADEQVGGALAAAALVTPARRLTVGMRELVYIYRYYSRSTGPREALFS